MIQRSLSVLIAFISLTTCPVVCSAQDIPVPNGSFEESDDATGFAAGWIRGFGPGTQANAEIDTSVAHTGRHSLRITDATPTQAYRYALVNTSWIEVQPRTTYELRCQARGRDVGKAASLASLMKELASTGRDYPLGTMSGVK